MNKPKITIIDTGCANLSSVKLAFDRLGVDTTVSFDPDDIRKADKLILPGVGTAVAAMQMLRERRLVDLIREARQPLLGICLGMQMLATLSEEKMNSGENVPCLDLVKARVGLMQTGGLRLPHMGWDQITAIADHPLLKGIPDGSYFYFVHSYAMEVCEGTVATCDYGGKFTAVVQHGNFTGTQFHPEKSGATGARLLTNFVEM